MVRLNCATLRQDDLSPLCLPILSSLEHSHLMRTKIALGSYYLASLSNVATGENITPLAWQIPDYVHSVAFSADGTMVE